MKHLIILLSVLLISCRDDKWGDKILNFAINEAPTIIEELSRKDLEEKWFQFFLINSQYSLQEINKAHLMIAAYTPVDLLNVSSDNVKLMSAAYQIDQQIKKVFEIHQIIYSAQTALQGMNSACENSALLEYYTNNRFYLYNSLQMAVPMLNVTYGATVTFSFGSDGTNKKENTSEEAIPLIGNVFSYFSQKSFKENMSKFRQAQDQINNIKLNPTRLKLDSDSTCNKNKLFFERTNENLSQNIIITQNELKSLYSALIKSRDFLAPKVIQNIVANFSSENQLVYSIEADNRFTLRVQQIYAYVQNIQTREAKNINELILLENSIDTLDNFAFELRQMNETMMGIKNNKLINSLSALIKNKKNKLSMQFLKGVVL